MTNASSRGRAGRTARGWSTSCALEGTSNVAALLTTINEPAQRVAMHAVRVELLDAQADALGLPAVEGAAPFALPQRDLRARPWPARSRERSAEGFTHVAFGDLFLEDIRRYREDRLAGTGLTPLFPLFGADTSALAREMVASGLAARLLRRSASARP